jgi:RpiR family carbohydrate utilization transcriptional regulator
MTESNLPISSSNKSKLPSRGAGNLLDILRSSVPDLNNGEAKVARVILASTEWVAQSSIKAVAGKAAVSEPTVLRMCRRIGLEGFKALKHRLAQDLILSQVLNGPHLEDSDASPSELVKVMLDASMGALRGAAQKPTSKFWMRLQLRSSKQDRLTALVWVDHQVYCVKNSKTACFD